MRVFILLLALTTLSLFGASFDCTKTKSHIEKVICQDEELSHLDEKLDSVYKEALVNGTHYDFYTPNAKKMQQAQRQWIKKRDTCHVDVDCLVDMYRSRLSDLIHGDLDDKPPTQLSPVKYTLVLNENNAMCSHLLELYNHDIEQFQKVNYDNHGEFNWLKWEPYVQPDKDSRVHQLIGGAFFDINNDGKEDFIFAQYSSVGGSKTEHYSIYDHNVSDFFKHSPTYSPPYDGKFPPFALFFDDIGNSDTTWDNLDIRRSIGGISYALISKHFDQLPPYIVKELQETKKEDDAFNAKYKNFTHYEMPFYPVYSKNEIRFLKWNDNKIYVVFEGSNYFQSRYQFNLIGYLKEDYIFHPQCLFYKKIR